MVVQLTLVLVITLATLLAGLAIASYVGGRKFLREQVRQRLAAAVENRRSTVRAHMSQLQQRAVLSADRGEFRWFLEQLGKGTDDKTFRNYAGIGLERVCGDRTVLAGSLIDAKGNVILSREEKNVGKNIASDPAFVSGLRAHWIGLPEERGKRFVARVLTPVREITPPEAVCGVLDLTIDVTPLARAVRDGTGLGKTGEVLLGVREGERFRLLFPPRLTRDVAMLTPDKAPALFAALDSEAMVRGELDDRGEPVLAMAQVVSSNGWTLIAKLDEREADKQIEWTRDAMLMLGSVILLLGVVGAYAFARNFTRPIRRLAEAAEAVARGNLGVSVPVRSGNELGTLSAAFNDMTAALRARTNERELAETSLAAERTRLRTLIDVMPTFAYVKDTQSRFIVANAPCARALNVKMEDLVGKSDADFFPAALTSEYRADEERVLKGEAIIGKEETMVLPDGTKLTVLTTKVPLRDSSGKIVGLVGNGLDITQRKRADEAIRQSEELLRSIVDHTEDSIFVKDRQSRTIFKNPAGLRANALPPEKVLGHTDTEFSADPEQAEKFLADDRRVMETRQTETFEEVLTSATGEKHVLLTTKTPRFDGAGQVVGLVGVARDITERKAAEEKLRELNERYELVVTGAYAAIWDWDVIAKRVYYSPRWIEMRGYTEGEVSDREEEWSSGIHPEDKDRVIAAIRAHVAGETPVFSEEYRIRCKDGSWKWVLDRGIARRDASGRAIRMAGSETEITMRKRAEEALRESEERYRLLADYTEEIVMLNDTHGNRLYISPSFFRKTGWTVEEVMSADWRARVHPEDLSHVEAARNANLAGEFTVIEHRTLARNGEWIWVETSCKPITDPEGKVWRLLVWSHEIGERKRADAEMRASLHEKEVLLREVHHRVKNNLQIVSSLLNLQVRQLTDPAMMEIFVRTRDRVRAMAAVHERLYESGDFAQIDLAAHLSALVRTLVRAHVPEGFRIQTALHLAKTAVDLNAAVPLSLIASELIINSVKYAFADRHAGMLTIELTHEDGFHRLRFADDGPGFPPAVDPSTTRTLGLRLVRDLSRQVGGELHIDSSAAGADIVLRWPARYPSTDRGVVPAEETDTPVI